MRSVPVRTDTQVRSFCHCAVFTCCAGEVYQAGVEIKIKGFGFTNLHTAQIKRTDLNAACLRGYLRIVCRDSSVVCRGPLNFQLIPSNEIGCYIRNVHRTDCRD
ncbi:hypothetical protein SDC9_161926 [bioreactor metagenome]|uniref:Uncharacterized protein n=1 Tax=bioreactor metagenome TaxID=1076179 RepID=A0A645FMN3_9ZZZZ